MGTSFLHCMNQVTENKRQGKMRCLSKMYLCSFIYIYKPHNVWVWDPTSTVSFPGVGTNGSMQLLSHTWHGNAARLKSPDFLAHVFTGREARVKCCEAVSACVSMSQHGSTCKWPGRCMASKAAAAMGVGGRCCRGLDDISCSTSSQLLKC